jgi:hypothetical protein
MGEWRHNFTVPDFGTRSRLLSYVSVSPSIHIYIHTCSTVAADHQGSTRCHWTRSQANYIGTTYIHNVYLNDIIPSLSRFPLQRNPCVSALYFTTESVTVERGSLLTPRTSRPQELLRLGAGTVSPSWVRDIRRDPGVNFATVAEHSTRGAQAALGETRTHVRAYKTGVTVRSQKSCN